MTTAPYGAVCTLERQGTSLELITELTGPAEKEVPGPSARGGLGTKWMVFLGALGCSSLALTSPFNSKPHSPRSVHL